MRTILIVQLMNKQHHSNLASFCFLICLTVPLDSRWRQFNYITSDNNDLIFTIEEYSDQGLIIRDDNAVVAKCKSNGIENVHIFDDVVYRLCMEVLITKPVLHFHSSFVMYIDQAILFTGPSGIGKTTQAELWRDYEDAIIVNGDVTLIRKIDDVWRAFGAPIHGSSPYCENMDAPIAAIIVLKQAEENQLIRLDAFTALGECFPEIYRPEMSDETYEILLDTVDALFSEIPVYQLSCRPDRESVELVKQTLFDQNPEL